MRYAFWSLGVCVLLSGCMKAQDNSVRVLDSVEKETATSWQKMRDYLDLSGKPPEKHRRPSLQPRYCYKTYEDVVCYASPIPGQEERLLAFQAAGKVGYVVEPPRVHEEQKKKETTKSAAQVPVKAEAAAPSPTPEPTPAPTSAPAPQAAESAPAQAQAQAAASPAPTPPAGDKKDAAKPEAGKAENAGAIKTKHLKEITFDPAELAPKALVPGKEQ